MPDTDLTDLDTLAKSAGVSLDDDYQTRIVERANTKDLDWFNEQAKSLGIEGVETGQPKPKDGSGQAASQSGTQTATPGETPASGDGKPVDWTSPDGSGYFPVLDYARRAAADVAKVPGDMANIAVGGPLRALQAMADLVKIPGDYLDAKIGGIQIFDPDGNLNPQLMGPEAFAEFKKAIDPENKGIQIPNIGGVMDRPDDSMTASFLQSAVQFLTGWGVVGKALPALKAAPQMGGTVGNFVKESGKLWARAELTDFAAFDGHEGNLANLLQLVPALKGPVTDFLATDETTPELEGRLKNAIANAPLNMPFDLFVRRLSAMKEARKVKALTGTETYADAAKKLAEGGIPKAEAQAPVVGSKIEQLLGRENEDIVKFVDPYVDQTRNVDMIARALRGELPEAGSQSRFSLDGQASEQDNLGFYSKALESARALKQDKGTPEQMRAQLRTAGVKESELQAVGLDKVLEGKKSVTKDEIVQHLESNRVRVQEVNYRDATRDDTLNWADAMDREARRPGINLDVREELLDLVSATRRGDINGADFQHGLDGAGLMPETVAAVRRAAVQVGIGAPRTKWTNYSLDPSNPTYRETVLHLPPVEARKPINMADPVAEMRYDVEYTERYNRDNFRSGHWQEPNVIAHARTQILTDAKGRKVFNIDELQSDWGQKVRDGGVRDEAKIAELQKQLDAAKAERDAWIMGEPLAFVRKYIPSMRADDVTAEDVLGNLARIARNDMGAFDRVPVEAMEQASGFRLDPRMDSSLVDRLAAEISTAKAATPGHPLVNTTDQWTTTALRRLIRQAVESGADAISLTPGKVQAERFGLERHFTSVDVTPRDAEAGSARRVVFRGARGDSLVFDVGKDGVVASGQIGVGQPLSEVVGKELAARIMEPTASRTLANAELKTGGEGMKSTYDQMYPRTLGKMLAKIDPSVKQELAAIKAEKYSGDVISFPLTDKIKQSVAKEGFPLFSLEDLKLTGKAQAEKDAIRAELADLGKRLPDGVTLKIEPRRATAGEYDPVDRIMYVSLAAENPARVFRHEEVHALRDINLIPESDWALLTKHAEKKGLRKAFGIDEKYGKLYEQQFKDAAERESILQEEVIAEMVARYNSGEKFGGKVDAILKRIKDFLRAVRDRLGVKGFRTVDDVFEGFEAGAFATHKDGQPVAPKSRYSLEAQTADPQQAGTKQTGQVYINWARINSPEDVKQAIQMTADHFAPEIDQARRGIRTNAMTEAAAGNENAWKLLIGERKGNLPRAEEQLALRQLWASSGQKVMELSKLAAQGGQEEMFAFRRMMAVHNMIQQQVIGIRTETARALQQWSIPAGGDGEKLRQLKFAIEANGGEGVTRALAERIAILAGRPGFEAAVDQMIQKGAYAKSIDTVREIWINSILSGPKTHIVNMMSNSAVVGQSILERAIAGRLGDILDPVEGVRIGEATAMMYGVKQAQKDALTYAAKTLRTGESGYGRGQIEGPRERAISAEGWGVDSDTALGKGLDMVGSVVNLPGRMLTAEDEFFKTINYRAELWAQAYRQGMGEIDRGVIRPDGLKTRMVELITDPPENLRLKAADMAAYNTFQSEPGDISKTVMRFRSAVDDAFGLPIGTMVMPFINTPGNIMKYTFERTPLAPLMSHVQADIRAGGSRRDLALARIGLGTILVTSAYDLAMDGHVTGSGPDGDRGAGERQLLKRSGWQPYSIRIRTGGTDEKPEYRYVAYNRMDPLGSLFGMSAELAETMRNDDGRQNVDYGEVIAGLILGASQTYMNKSYFSGVAGIIEAMQNPDRYGEAYMTRILSSFVPAAAAEAARWEDPIVRHNYDTISAIKARIPGLSATLPPRLNFWGEPMTYQSGMGSLYDLVSPIYTSSNAKAKDIDKEFMSVDFFPTHKATITIDGKAISLRNDPEITDRIIGLTSTTKASDLVDANFDDMANGKKKAQLNRLMEFGEATLPEALKAVISGSSEVNGQSYTEADTDEKKKILSDVIRAFRSAAQTQAIREFPDLKKRRADIDAQTDPLSPDAPF